MTAAANEANVRVERQPGAGALMGFSQFFRKEISEWLASRRALVVFAVTSFLVAGTTVAPWLQATLPGSDAEAPASSVVMDPTINLVGANWNQWLTYIAIFAAMGLLAGERDKGTLAWSLSKPLSRPALLLAKWSAGTLVYAVVGVVLPMLVGIAVAAAAYGSLPDLMTVALFSLAMLSLPAFYIALSIALGTRIQSQAAVAGIGLAASFLPALAGLISVEVGRVMPPAMSSWALAQAGGQDVGVVTPVGWLVGMVVVAAAAHVAFARAEL